MKFLIITEAQKYDGLCDYITGVAKALASGRKNGETV